MRSVEDVEKWVSNVNSCQFLMYAKLIIEKDIDGPKLLTLNKKALPKVLYMKKSHMMNFNVFLRKIQKQSKKYQNNEWPLEPEAEIKVI